MTDSTSIFYVFFLFLVFIASSDSLEELMISGKLPTSPFKEVKLFSLEEEMINGDNNDDVGNNEKSRATKIWRLKLSWSPSVQKVIARHGQRGQHRDIFRVSKRRTSHHVYIRVLKPSLHNYLIEVYLGCHPVGEFNLGVDGRMVKRTVAHIQFLNHNLAVLSSGVVSEEDIRSKEACNEDKLLEKQLKKIHNYLSQMPDTSRFPFNLTSSTLPILFPAPNPFLKHHHYNPHHNHNHHHNQPNQSQPHNHRYNQPHIAPTVRPINISVKIIRRPPKTSQVTPSFTKYTPNPMFKDMFKSTMETMVTTTPSIHDEFNGATKYINNATTKLSKEVLRYLQQLSKRKQRRRQQHKEQQQHQKQQHQHQQQQQQHQKQQHQQHQQHQNQQPQQQHFSQPFYNYNDQRSSAVEGLKLSVLGTKRPSNQPSDYPPNVYHNPTKLPHHPHNPSASSPLSPPSSNTQSFPYLPAENYDGNMFLDDRFTPNKHTDTDDPYTSNLMDIKNLLRNMQDNMRKQSQEITKISDLMAECNVCGRLAGINREARPLSSLEQSASSLNNPCSPNPCFKSTQCIPDPLSLGGFLCGLCPEGFKGNGFKCEVITCGDDPCYQGVSCTNNDYGQFQCGECPKEMQGNGKQCVPEPNTCAVKQPCYPHTVCQDTENGPLCGQCPLGMTGNGRGAEGCRQMTCSDLECPRGVKCIQDSVQLIPKCGSCLPGYIKRHASSKDCIKNHCSPSPCYPGVSCQNSHRRPNCGACPQGMTGKAWGKTGCHYLTCAHDVCYPGVECIKSSAGVKCGNCSKRMVGTGVGREGCRPATCEEITCHPGVRCLEDSGGAKCGGCPNGMSGDGWDCVKVFCRDRPCYKDSSCVDAENGFVCGKCPDDKVGDGSKLGCRKIGCNDNPCVEGVRCYQALGLRFKCGACPSNHTGNAMRIGLGATGCNPIVFNCTSKTCFPGVKCQEGSYGPRCGNCPSGYLGNGTLYGCWKIRCKDNPCDTKVYCHDTHYHGFKCGKCPKGWEGDGVVVGGGKGCVAKRCTPKTCYPGVKCLNDLDKEPTCGKCPGEMIGNGTFNGCRNLKCSDKPCYLGIACYESTLNSYTCGKCPDFMTGSGKGKDGCVYLPRESCHPNPCYNDRPCVIDAALGPVCGECPTGMRGDGKTCEDVDECKEFSPCDQITACTNLKPGFECSPCPRGYVSVNVTRSNVVDVKELNYKIMCQDIDECSLGTHVCVNNSLCVKTIGSYTCGDCLEGYTGGQKEGCAIDDSLCGGIGGVVCSVNATCEHVSSLQDFACQCNVGYGGDGRECDLDKDMDGFPDNQLSCSHKKCAKDNCPTVPNSGQEDGDEDGVGDVCDDDIDNDGVPNVQDNCPYTFNPDQLNSEEVLFNSTIESQHKQQNLSLETLQKDDKKKVIEFDSFGDVCDNCPNDPNTDQLDGDEDGMGDTCDPDQDNDGILNMNDNCPLISNLNQSDDDNDGVGNECDNCPQHHNPSQEDSDHDKIGDKCDDGDDKDMDGIQDSMDNCKSVYNADQTNNDEDELGDACDDDDDNDGVVDTLDNCPLVPNANQTDTDGNGKGDECELDEDGDGMVDTLDTCSHNKHISSTNFKNLQSINLDPHGNSQNDPKWETRNNGAEIVQLINSDPGIAIGESRYGNMDFSGTFYVNSDEDDDYGGFVFSYQDSSNFYVVMWKRLGQTYWQSNPFRAVAEPAIQLKSVHSETGPGEILRNALWHTGDTADEVSLLWKDPRNEGWKNRTSYRWHLQHRPSVGLIRLKFFEDRQMIADSGDLYDLRHRGGRMGVFCFSQEQLIWSDLQVKCNDTTPERSP